MTPMDLQGLWRLLNLPCEGMSRLASESFDRKLGSVERLALRSHQLYCRGCQREGKQLHFLHAASRELLQDIEAPASTTPLAIPAKLPQADRDRIKKALQASEMEGEPND